MCEAGRLKWVTFVLIITVCMPASAIAQDEIAGEAIARTWCVNCHQVSASGAVMRGDAPSFSSISQMPSTTEASLAVFLSTPHDRMPDYVLSRSEIRNISAYILSLRKLKTDAGPGAGDQRDPVLKGHVRLPPVRGSVHCDPKVQ